MLGLFPGPWWLPWFQLVAVALAVFLTWRAFRSRTQSRQAFWINVLCVAACLSVLFGLLSMPTRARVNRAYYNGKDQFQWLTQLQDGNDADRQEAVVALCDILRNGKLRDPGWDAEIAKRLGRLGPEALASLPTLRELARNEDQWVREAALQAIQSIDPEEYKKLIESR